MVTTRARFAADDGAWSPPSTRGCARRNPSGIAPPSSAAATGGRASAGLVAGDRLDGDGDRRASVFAETRDALARRLSARSAEDLGAWVYGGDDDDDGQSSSDSDSKSATGDTAGDLGDDKSEIKSQSVSHHSRWAKQAALAHDWGVIDDVLGCHNTAKYIPKNITFAHEEDNGKGKSVEKAVLLIPRPDYSNPLASGSAPTSENTDAIFEKSILVRDGVYTEVEETDQYINVSRKLAVHARRTQSVSYTHLTLPTNREV